jgi:NTE family protein
VIEFVRLDNQSRIGDETILSRISLKPGESLDPTRLDADIGKIYGMDVFESVRYEVVQEDGKTGMVVHAKEKSWGPNYLQFGIKLSDDMDSNSSYNLGVLYTRTAINSLNGEIRLGLQIGADPTIAADWYQPLDTATPYFFALGGGMRRNPFNVYAGDEVISEYSIERTGMDLAFGREFGTWGEGRVGYRWARGNAEVQVGDPALDNYEFQLGQIYAWLFMDTLDNVYFPHSGNKGKFELITARKGLGSDNEYDQALLSFSHAHSWGRNSLVGGFSFNTTLDDDAPPESLFRTGGFLHLSGYSTNQLSGQHSGGASVVYYRRISDMKILPAYLGGSIEYGNVWQDSSDIALDDGIFNGSLFLGADTPIGPLYMGLGLAEGGKHSLFLYLGPAF